MVASQVIANRETGVTSHVLSFFGPAIQNVRFGLIFRVVWRKGYVAARRTSQTSTHSAPTSSAIRDGVIRTAL